MTKTILLVEDEARMLEGLQKNLIFEGYKVDTAADGYEGQKKILQNEYDLAILDVMLPGPSGFDICREARNAGMTLPIIMLTAKGEEIDRVLGLELGADDYVTKPFSLRELVARIKAHLRRSEMEGAVEGADVHQLGRLNFDIETHMAKVDGKTVRMSSKEFEILAYFLKHPTKVISRQELLEQVWGYRQVLTTRTVDNFIYKLRQKVERDPNFPRHIITAHGSGYKLLL